MTEIQIRQLCERVSSLMDQVDEESDFPSFVENLDDIEKVLLEPELLEATYRGL